MSDEFEDKGFIVLRDAFPASACKSMRDAIWEALCERSGLLKSDPSTWRVEQPRGLGFLREAGAFDQVGSAAVVRAVYRILGVGSWDKPKHWGGPLVTFPATGDWSYPATGWHIDYPARGNLRTPFAVKMLGLIDDMDSQGGATLLAPGSHHLV